MTTLKQYTLATLIAKDLKKEMTKFGIKVLMCKQGSNLTHTNVAIEGSLKNFALFQEFAKLNNLVNSMNVPHKQKYSQDEKYIDLYGVFKLESTKTLIVK